MWKKAEEELFKAAKEWRITFDSISDFVSVIDKDYRFEKVNRSLAAFLGTTPEELVGKHCYEVLHGMDEPYPGCPHVETQKTMKPVTNEIYEKKHGVHLLVAVSPIIDENGELKGVVHFAKDISERKKLEKEIEETNGS